MIERVDETSSAELRARFDLIHVAPQNLAPLVSHALRLGRSGQELRDAIQDRLIDLTLRQAAEQSEFYHERIAHIDLAQPATRQCLRSIPLLSRRDVEDAGDALKLRHARFAFCSYTSGTTSGRPLLVDRCEQEEYYLQEFFSVLNEFAPSVDWPLVLSLAGTHHGRVLQAPGLAYVFPVSLSGTYRLHQALGLLRREFRIDGAPRRISVIAGPTDRVLKLSAYISTVDAEEFRDQVKAIHVGGDYLPRYRREWLSSCWGCPVSDVYSLTEFFIRAEQCKHCGWYHFSREGVAEVVGYSSSNPVSNGRGRLVLTSLYPFTQMMPFIRYLPGDLAEVRYVDCPVDTRGYRFLGRQRTALNLSAVYGDGDAFLSGGEVYEVLEPLPDVRRPTRALRLPTFCQSVGNLPMFALRPGSKEQVPGIDIELTYAPSLFPERVAEVRQHIKEGIAAQSPKLGEALDRGLLEVSLLPPDSLGVDSPPFRP